jgi:hypothetical protein
MIPHGLNTEEVAGILLPIVIFSLKSSELQSSHLPTEAYKDA